MEQLFQKRVLQDYVNKQDKTLLKQRWKNFQNFLAKKDATKRKIIKTPGGNKRYVNSFEAI